MITRVYNYLLVIWRTSSLITSHLHIQTFSYGIDAYGDSTNYHMVRD